MSASAANSSATGQAITRNDADTPVARRALRQLFLTLFLRGHSARGLQPKGAPRSIGSKLALTLGIYALVGLFTAGAFHNQPVFFLSLFLHGLTFAFVGMFVASSSGEMLFNREEADILLHRPITPAALLWAKVRVLVDVSLWLAFSFNLAGFFIGATAPGGNWFFLPAHVLSISLEALFCTGTVVVVYQLCLRWCGRERLDNLMTAAQIVVSIGAILGSQLLPRLIMRDDGRVLAQGEQSPWIVALPPAWFAGIDDALTTGLSPRSCLLAAVALAVTGTVSWLAFSRLADNYATGLQSIGETIARRPDKARRRWLERLVDRPPLRWMLSDPVTRASFLLVAAYLVRDRDVKLRVYPGLAPMLVLPVMLVLPAHGQADPGGFPIAMCGTYVSLLPILAISMLQFSQQWQAADVFRAAPMPGPGALCAGARQAVLWLLVVPTFALMALLIVLLSGSVGQLPLLLPGAIALPVYLLLPHLRGKHVPLSMPIEEAKGAGRGLFFTGTIFVSLLLAGLANLLWWNGYFLPFVAAEAIVVAALYAAMCRRVAAVGWPREA